MAFIGILPFGVVVENYQEAMGGKTGCSLPRRRLNLTRNLPCILRGALLLDTLIRGGGPFDCRGEVGLTPLSHRSCLETPAFTSSGSVVVWVFLGLLDD